MPEYKSRVIKIGKLLLGGDQPVRVQSMTQSPTMDTNTTVNEVIKLAAAGCDLVRITAANKQEAYNLKNIKNSLHKKGIFIPLVADIHFLPEAADIAAEIVEKIRINPGNYSGSNHKNKIYDEKTYQEELFQTKIKLRPLIKKCKKYGTTIRIGINHGSLSDRILYRYGNTAEGMVASAMEFLTIFREENFNDVVISLKASNVPLMIKANLLLKDEMIKSGYNFPVHLGVTEAGNGMQGRLKAAAGIGMLLKEGFGDTIRVSLSEKSENEIPVAKKLISFFSDRNNNNTPTFNTNYFSFKTNINFPYPLVISETQNTYYDITPDKLKPKLSNDKTFDKTVIQLSYKNITYEDMVLRAAADYSYLTYKNPPAGIWITNKEVSSEKNAFLSLEILQALGFRYSKAEFIACPTCGRTLFDVEKTLETVKSKLSTYKGVKIAVMGCIVNGPGEMADTDLGMVGTVNGKVNLYLKGKQFQKNLTVGEAISLMEVLIKTHFSEKVK